MKKGIITLLCVFLLASVIWAEDPFYKDLNQAQRYELSQAYLAVSEHYKEMGETDRANGYKAVADMLLNSIDDFSQVESAVVEGSEENMTETASQEDMVDERTQRAVLYYFSKLSASLSAGNVDQSMNLLAFPFQAGENSLSESQLRTDVQELADMEYSVEGLWDLDSASFRYEGNTVVLSLTPAVEDPGLFVFWMDPQEFVFVQAERGWKLQAIR